jgi:hypothetical protein
MPRNYNLPPGCISKDIEEEEVECLYCYKRATHDYKGQPLCKYHYNNQIEEDEEPTDNNTTSS